MYFSLHFMNVCKKVMQIQNLNKYFAKFQRFMIVVMFIKRITWGQCLPFSFVSPFYFCLLTDSQKQARKRWHQTRTDRITAAEWLGSSVFRFSAGPEGGANSCQRCLPTDRGRKKKTRALTVSCSCSHSKQMCWTGLMNSVTISSGGP